MMNYTGAAPSEAQRARFCRLPLFEHYTEQDIEHLLADARILELESGDILVEEGAAADAAFYVLEGELDILRRIGKEDVPIATRPSGDLVGEMSLLIGEPRTATLRARVPTKVLEISYERLHETLLSNSEGLFLLLRNVAARLKHSESSLVHYQKLAGLGTLAAGLAHELNNPSSAIVRSASQLEESLLGWERWTEKLGSLALTPDQRGRIEQLRDEIQHTGAGRRFDDVLERADEEDKLLDWLTDKQVSDAATVAVALVDAGKNVIDVRAIEEEFGREQLDIVLNWIAARESIYIILHSLRASGGAISEIVAGVKSYTHLDQAPVQDVDVHDGIDQTLVILRHQLRGIDVHRLYAKDLPRITAFASELNQVWANLIDNAADAVDGKGEITIRTSVDDGSVVVEISDTGPGIPIDAQQHLFEPFFTTKPVGKGTGLGLSISYNIVRKHGGVMTFRTSPGQTTFVVRLPIDGGFRHPAMSVEANTSEGSSR